MQPIQWESNQLSRHLLQQHTLQAGDVFPRCSTVSELPRPCIVVRVHRITDNEIEFKIRVRGKEYMYSEKALTGTGNYSYEVKPEYIVHGRVTKKNLFIHLSFGQFDTERLGVTLSELDVAIKQVGSMIQSIL